MNLFKNQSLYKQDSISLATWKWNISVKRFLCNNYIYNLASALFPLRTSLQKLLFEVIYLQEMLMRCIFL